LSGDSLHRFSFANAPVRGQWVRLSGVLEEFRQRQDYPPGVDGLLSEMLAAVAMVSEGIQFDGAVSLQSRSSGPLTMVLAECRDGELLRGIARWPEDAPTPTETELQALLGGGQLTITMTRPAARDGDQAFSYQGLIELTGRSLAANLEKYFANSEQLPTHFYFAADARNSITGLMLQRLPSDDLGSDMLLESDDRLWTQIRQQAELLDLQHLAKLEPEVFLPQAFSGHTINLHPPRQLRFDCSCSRSRSSNTLRTLPREEILSLLEERGSINVTSEICGASYDYQPVDIHMLMDPGSNTIH
jgi:molecular chaperone Hsp33